MRHIIDVGTEVATLCVFDPQALPESFDEAGADALDVLRQMRVDERAFVCGTGADGSFVLHVSVNETISPELLKHLKDPVPLRNFRVPSGTLIACGAESASRAGTPPEPGVGAVFKVEPGTYDAVAYRGEWPSGTLSQRFLEKTKGGFFLFRHFSKLVAVAVLAIIGAVPALWLAPDLTWRLVVAAAVLLAVLVPVFVAGTKKYKEGERLTHELERELPSFFLELNGPQTDDADEADERE